MKTFARLLCAAAVTVAAPALAGSGAGSGTDSGAGLGAALKSAGTGTVAGATRVVELLRPGLLADPQAGDAHARALCGQYLPAAINRLTTANDAGAFVTRLNAQEALAQCRWLSGDTAGARAATEELLKMCQRDGCAQALVRAVRLAERWLWPEPVAEAVTTQLAAVQSNTNTRRPPHVMNALRTAQGRLADAAAYRSMVIEAFGGSDAIKPGVLVASTNGIERWAVRRGEVLLNVAARRVANGAELAAALAAGKPPFAFLVMTKGSRREGRWMGPLAGLTLIAVPERIVPPEP